MRISQSTLDLQSQSASYSSRHVQQNLNIDFRLAAVVAGNANPAETGRVAISDAARDTLAAAQASDAVTDENAKAPMDPRLQILVNIIEQLTGRPIQLFDADELNGPAQSTAESNNDSAARADTPGSPEPEWSMHFERREVTEEAQATRFQASGSVKTTDGREISFDLELEMARFARSESVTTLDAGNVRRKDPLILNLQGGTATLTAERFAFDLDGKPDTPDDMIARLGHGSAFLALDRNANGKIDDGSELFGPSSGDGFAELSQLDSDDNGWIDEADAAFARLGVWEPGKELRSLSAAGVGAIALENVATPFALKEGSDDKGQIQSTGIFLHEDGRPGTIQHVDLTV